MPLSNTQQQSIILLQQYFDNLYSSNQSPNKPTNSIQQAQIPNDGTSKQHSGFEDTLAAMVSAFNELNERLSRAKSFLSNSQNLFQQISQQNKDLEKICGDALSQCRLYESLAKDISIELQYFTFYEDINKIILNQPGDSLCRQSTFPQLFDRIIHCLQHMRDKQHYKDAHLYIIRYDQLVDKCLELITVFFESKLSYCFSGDEQLKDGLLRDLKKLMDALQLHNSIERVHQAFMKCMDIYFAFRFTQISPLLTSRALEYSQLSLSQAIKKSIEQNQSLYDFELKIFQQISTESEEFADHFESLLVDDYLAIRSYIIHANSILELSEILKYIRSKSNININISSFLEDLASDVQQRLLFRCQAEIKERIENYQWVNDDKTKWLDLTTASQDLIFGPVLSALSFYPHLFNVVDNAIFQTFMADLIVITVECVMRSATAMFSATPDVAQDFNRQIFIHFQIQTLREHLSKYLTGFSPIIEKNVDLTGLRAASREFLERATSYNLLNLLQATVPVVSENVVNPRELLDNLLKDSAVELGKITDEKKRNLIKQFLQI